MFVWSSKQCKVLHCTNNYGLFASCTIPHHWAYFEYYVLYWNFLTTIKSWKCLANLCNTILPTPSVPVCYYDYIPSFRSLKLSECHLFGFTIVGACIVEINTRFHLSLWSLGVTTSVIMIFPDTSWLALTFLRSVVTVLELQISSYNKKLPQQAIG